MQKKTSPQIPLLSRIITIIVSMLCFGFIGLLISLEFAELGSATSFIFIGACMAAGLVTYFVSLKKWLGIEHDLKNYKIEERETAPNQVLLDRADELMRQEMSKRKIGIYFLVIFALVLVVCLCYSAVKMGIATQNNASPATLEIALFCVSVMAFMILYFIITIYNKHEYKITSRNERTAEGIIALNKTLDNSGTFASKAITTRTISKIYIYLPSIDKVLVARNSTTVKIQKVQGEFVSQASGARIYTVGEPVLVKYDYTKPKKCIIIG